MLFGGKSVEHEVSVITGIQALLAMDTEKYDVIPVYMTKKNEMYIGESIGDIEAYKDIPALLNKSQRVVMMNEDGKVVLMPYPLKKFGKNKETAVDIVFPAVHGTNVEDGTLQGFLKTLGVPFVGCDVTASAIGMDKFIMKAVLKEYDIPVPCDRQAGQPWFQRRHQRSKGQGGAVTFRRRCFQIRYKDTDRACHNQSARDQLLGIG